MLVCHEIKFVLSFLYRKAKLHGVDPNLREVVEEIRYVYGRESINKKTASCWFEKFALVNSIEEWEKMILADEKNAGDI